MQKFSQKISYTKLDMVSTNEDTSTADSISKAPDLNGKMILPIKIAAAGLKGHKVAAVYAILDSNYKRGWVLYVWDLWRCVYEIICKMRGTIYKGII